MAETGQPTDEQSKGDSPSRSSRRKTIDEIRAAARDARDYAQLPLSEIDDRPRSALRGASFWEARVSELVSAGRATDARLDSIRELEAASARLRVSLDEWAVLREFPGAQVDLEAAQKLKRVYLSSREAVTDAASDVLREFGRPTSATDPVIDWMKENLADPKTWSILLAMAGIVVFAYVRILDTVVYAPYGVTPDETGRTYATTIPYSVTLLAILAVFAPLAIGTVAYLFMMLGGIVWVVIGGAVQNREGSDRELTRQPGERHANSAPRHRRKVEPDLDPWFNFVVRALPVIAFLTVAATFVLFSFLYIRGARESISSCRTLDASYLATGGWQVETVAGTIPPLPTSIEDHQLLYLGTGPSHSIVYDCTGEETIRLSKSYAIIVDPHYRANED